MSSPVKRIFLSLALISTPVMASGQVAAYEGQDSFPEEQGWQRDDRPNFPERWLQNGWFVERTKIASLDPYAEQDDIYRRSLAGFAGAPSLFAEFRLQTDGITVDPWQTAPAALALSGTMGVVNHFTIGANRMRFVNSYASQWYYPLDASPHTLRLELRNLDYAAFLDGRLINSGTVPRPYPDTDSFIVFGNRASGDPDPCTTRWDYIRFGVIPDDAGPGDTNCDGTINLFDIDPFVTALIDADGYGRAHPACNRMLADTNADGTVNIMDIDSFVALLTE